MYQNEILSIDKNERSKKDSGVYRRVNGFSFSVVEAF